MPIINGLDQPLAPTNLDEIALLYTLGQRLPHNTPELLDAPPQLSEVRVSSSAKKRVRREAPHARPVQPALGSNVGYRGFFIGLSKSRWLTPRATAIS
jgi:hypothetical protein